MDYFNYHPDADTNRGVEADTGRVSEPLTETQVQIIMYVDALASMVSMFERLAVYSWVSSLGPGEFPTEVDSIPEDVRQIVGASEEGYQQYLRWLEDRQQESLANAYGDEEFAAAIDEMMGDN